MNLLLLIGANYLIFLLPILSLFLVLKKLRSGKKKEVLKDLVTLGLTLVLSSLITLLIRYFYPIERPFVSRGAEPLVPLNPSPGFPSEHAVLSFSFVNYLARQNNLFAFVSLLIAVIATAARVLAYLHTPQDIIAGAVIATIVYTAVKKTLTIAL